MIKRRPCVVLSPPIRARQGFFTIVPLSTTPPTKVMPYHQKIGIPFEMPSRFSGPSWIKGDMVNAVRFQRVELIRIGTDKRGKRIYQTEQLAAGLFAIVRSCVLHGLGLLKLTKHL